MSLRDVLINHRQLFGAISSSINKSIFSQNSLFNRSCVSIPLIHHSCRRHYYLPPPPPIVIVGNARSDPLCGGVQGGLNIEKHTPKAQFAVSMHNVAKDRDIRFVRLVRASGMMVSGFIYFLILEGIDENGDLNVYYAEVRSFINSMKLTKWQLVDESFSYPYNCNAEMSMIESLVKRIHHSIEGNRNILRASLPALRLHYGDQEELRASLAVWRLRSSDWILEKFKFHAARIYDTIDCGMMVNYALSALEMLNKTGKGVCLKEVLHAKKENLGDQVFYTLLLKVINDKKEFIFSYAILEVSQFKGELIKCHVVDELFLGCVYDICQRDNLPPPQPAEDADGPEYFGGVFAVSNLKEALASAQFAVTKYNETKGRNIRFVRVVRASRMVVIGGYDYYLTLEGIDENGDFNGYYAEVYDCPFETMKQLRKWRLVDESFSYPFKQKRQTSRFDNQYPPFELFCDGSQSVKFLPTLTLKYKDDTSHTSFDGDVVPVYNMIHADRVVYYALSVVEMLRKKGKEIRLEEVLHASKHDVDGKVLYKLLLKVIYDKGEVIFVHASLEVSEFKEELIKWFVVDDLFSAALMEKNRLL